MEYSQFWYVATESRSLTNRPIGVQILDEWIVCFRGPDGAPVALRDRCLHRCGRLSRGTIVRGELKCPYHGWQYDSAGKVVSIPSEGGRGAAAEKNLRSKPFETREQDGYVYVRLKRPAPGVENEPFPMPHWKERGWQNIRLVHDFGNNLSNCVENFIDVPHTSFVHRGIFRNEASEEIRATIRRAGGEVHVRYLDEKDNLGSYSWFLNPKGEEIFHTDSFYTPNVTNVVYRVGAGERVEYAITSQSVPVDRERTRVFTDITYRFGAVSWLARPIARRQARRVIRQDIDELDAQMKVIRKYGSRFIDSPADSIHKLVSEIHEALEKGEDPQSLPDSEAAISFFV